MSKYKVVLYLPGCAVVATENEELFGRALEFKSIEDAERYGASKGLTYDIVEIREKDE